MMTNNIEIEASIVACLKEWDCQIKTAMVIGSVIWHFKKLGHEVDETTIANRVFQLVEDGKISVFGDVKKWRHSEIVLSEQDTT